MNKENICFIYVCVKAEVKENLLAVEVLLFIIMYNCVPFKCGEGPESQTLTMKVRKITAAFLDPMATILRKKLNPEPENAW